MRRVFLSASVPTGRKRYPRAADHLLTAQPVLIRDAVLAMVREGLRSGFDFVFGAHPSIAPIVLTVAREFPSDRPRIEVFQSRLFEAVFPQETLELADGVLGLLTPVPAEPPPPAAPDREQSLAAMRMAIITSRELVAAIVIAGMDGVTDEATMFLSHHRRSLPLYALGSTGGAALDLFDRPPPGFSADDFCGGAAAPVERDLLCEQVPGYARVARAIFRAVAAAGAPPMPPLTSRA